MSKIMRSALIIAKINKQMPKTESEKNYLLD